MLERQQMQARVQAPQPQPTRPPLPPHGPPPGFMEPPAQQQRRGPQAPPGFPEVDDPSMVGLQRRKTTEIPPRSQMTNMGIPSQHAIPPDWMKNPPPGMPLPTHPDRGSIPPPPGFTTNHTSMRPPPGYPNGPQMPPNLGNGPLTHPAAMGGRVPPPGMFPGPPTPGYFGPNGPAQPGMNPPPPGPPGFMMMGPGGGRGMFDGFVPAPNDMGRGRGNPPGFNAY